MNLSYKEELLLRFSSYLVLWQKLLVVWGVAVPYKPLKCGITAGWWLVRTGYCMYFHTLYDKKYIVYFGSKLLFKQAFSKTMKYFFFMIFKFRCSCFLVFHTARSRWLRKCPIFFTQELSTMSLVVPRVIIGCGDCLFGVSFIYLKVVSFFLSWPIQLGGLLRLVC